jgi:hypothetical protein
VRAFIEYLYKEALPASCDANTLAELLGMAHKYQVESLEDDCTERLAADITPGSVLDVLQLAELYNSDRLRAAAYAVLRGKGQETVKEAGFFEHLEAYWAACMPVVAASSSGEGGSNNSGAVSRGGKLSKVGGEEASSAVATTTGKKGGKVGKSSKATVVSKIGAAVTTSSSTAAVAELGPTPTSASGPASAVRIPDEIREVIRALSESSGPRGEPPHTALSSSSGVTGPPCQCRICRACRCEVGATPHYEYDTGAEEDGDEEGYGDEFGADGAVNDDYSEYGDY